MRNWKCEKLSLKIWTEKQNHCQLGLDFSKALSVFLAGVGAVRCRQECWPGNADRQPDFIQVVHRNYSESEVTRKLMLLIFSIHIRQVLYRVTFSVVFSHPYSPKRQFQKKTLSQECHVNVVGLFITLNYMRFYVATIKANECCPC